MNFKNYKENEYKHNLAFQSSLINFFFGSIFHAKWVQNYNCWFKARLPYSTSGLLVKWAHTLNKGGGQHHNLPLRKIFNYFK